jgi:hypothetical protein
VKKLATVLSVWLLSLCATAASAATLPLGTLPAGVTPFANGHESGAFADSYTFSLASLSDLAASFTSVTNIGGFSGFLQQHTSTGWSEVGSFFSSSQTFDDLSKGSYRLEVFGGVPRNSGFYTGTLTVQAVPEADTWLMMLVGAGLVGFQLRRKQKSLPRQPFAAG